MGRGGDRPVVGTPAILEHGAEALGPRDVAWVDPRMRLLFG